MKTWMYRRIWHQKFCRCAVAAALFAFSAERVAVAEGSTEPSVTYLTVNPSRPDLLSMIPADTASDAVPQFPAVVHHAPTVVIAVPCELANGRTEQGSGRPGMIKPLMPMQTWVRFVALHSTTEQVIMRHREKVANGHARFQEIAPGSYDVYYLDEDRPVGNEEAPHRRIIVESVREQRAIRPVLFSAVLDRGLPEPTRAEPKQSPQWEVSVLSAAENAAVREGWNQLRLGNLFHAARTFQSIVHSSSLSPAGSLEAQFWQEFLDAQPIGTEALKRHGGGAAEAGRRLAAYVQERKELTAAVYGLAKAWDAVAQSPDSIVADADLVAEACYLAAAELNPRSAAVANDLGVFYWTLGRHEEGIEWLRKAAGRGRNALYAYNFGQALFATGDTIGGTAMWRVAIARDHRWEAPWLSLLQTRLRPDSPALYEGGCRELAYDLTQAMGDPNVPESTRRWAARTMLGLEVLGRELRLNQSPLPLRHMLGLLGAEESAVTPATMDAIDAADAPGVSPALGKTQEPGLLPLALPALTEESGAADLPATDAPVIPIQ